MVITSACSSRKKTNGLYEEVDRAALNNSLQKETMIKLTKIGGSECFMNHALIEIIEESPDTCITMTNGNRYLVLESGMEIQDKIILFNKEILQRAGNTNHMNIATQLS
jgi:flagellar protein FlbD